MRRKSRAEYALDNYFTNHMFVMLSKYKMEENMLDFLLQLDGNILLFIQDYIRVEWLNPIMTFITNLGNGGLIWIAIALLLLCTKEYKSDGIKTAIALIIGLLITNVLLKNAVHRIRPYEVIDGLNILISKQRDWSFPSGHATSSIAAAVVLFKTLPSKYGIASLILGIAICVSRLYVGVHYPSDILCGVLIGLFAAFISLKYGDRVIQKFTAKN